MAKTLTLFLASTPYSGQNAYTALCLAEAALSRRHAVHLFASADGVYLAVTARLAHAARATR